MPVATSRSTFTVTGHDGAALAVYADGPDDAPVTLVLAHGWTLDASAWQHQAEDLTRARSAAAGRSGGERTGGERADSEPTDAVRVVRYDQRGHGRSESGHSPWSIDLLGQDLAAVIEQTAPPVRWSSAATPWAG